MNIEAGTAIGYKHNDIVARVAARIEMPAKGLSLLVGRNGEGKSTFLKYCCGCLPMKPTCSTRTIYLPEELGFAAETTPRAIGQAILLGQGVSQYVGHAHYVDLPLDKPWQILSKGNKQKTRVLLALAQARENRAELVCLDEPFSGLDYVGRQQLWVLFKEVQAKAHILLSLHPENIRAERYQMIGVGRGMVFPFEATTDWNQITYILEHWKPEQHSTSACTALQPI